MTQQKKKFVLIDANALIHRAFHALPPLSTQKGELTNAVYGFTSILIKVIKELKPDYMIAAFDLAEPTFRHKEFKEYKAQRAKTPDDLIPQFEYVKEVLKAFNIPIFEKAGFEADDILGTITKKVKDKDIQKIILTGDLDTLQLIDENTVVYTLKKGISDVVIYDKKAVFERFGLEPYQMVDFKGLKGDPSDNIPGVPGVGDKTATALLKEYKTLEEIYNNIDLLPEKIKKKLEQYKDQAFFSKSLATIRQDVDIDFKLEDAKFGDYDLNKVIDVFKKFNFFTLISRIKDNTQIKDKKPTAQKIKVIFANEKDFERLLQSKKPKSVYFEKTSFYIFSEEKKVFVFDYLNAEKILNSNFEKIAFNLKDGIKLLKSKGIKTDRNFFDVKIAAYLISPGQRKYDLEKLIFDYNIDEIETDNKIVKNLYYSYSLYEKLKNELTKRKLKDLFLNIEMPLLWVLADMEILGIKVSEKKLKELSVDLEKLISKKEKLIYKLAGKEFNINSPSQLGVVLFDELKVQGDLKVSKTKKKGEYSTSEQELERLKDKHKIINEILEYRELFKLKTTYVDALLKLIDKKTGRIHTTFNQTQTATGRLSSSDPNLQNIPQKGEFAEKIRDAFISDKGYSLASFDYSQIELRIVAHLSGDENMISIFKKGGDIHTQTAMLIHKLKSENEVTKEQRRVAKVLNFGVLFGMGPKGVSDAAGISMHEAKEFITQYFIAFPKVKEFIENSIKTAKKRGYVQTELGRKRWIPEINSANWVLKNAAERMAQNMPIQGLEADILKLAMIDVYKKVIEKNQRVRLLLQVHDELIFEIKDDIITQKSKEIKDILEKIYKLKVPLKVSVQIGKSWGSLKKLEI